jgi:ABC-type molybdenum transport system ATPase subunit/photorepair protein PhrA
VIRRVTIERFKRFERVEFALPGHVVLAGPNNTGKTTVLQAIAAWGLALERFRAKNDFMRHGGAYSKVPVTRQLFSAVPLRSFDLLWRDRSYTGSIEIVLQTDQWTIPMEIMADSTEQVYVRPRAHVEPWVVESARLNTVFVPPMTGLSVDEPVYTRPKVDHLLGQARPGEALRNLLIEANSTESVWSALQASIRRLFNLELLRPNTEGPHIIAEYRSGLGRPLDIASAGSGFQQVLMLLTFLHTRPASLLLLDEPDAHLHVILQDAIYGELRAVAVEKKSQLVLATHSEVIINAVEPSELCVMLEAPRFLATTKEREQLISSLGVLSHEDIMLALEAPGVLYLEDYTDLQILREWARILGHPAHELLTTRLFWKRIVMQPRPGAEGIKARDHYDALQLASRTIPGLELLDGDAHRDIPPTEITGQGLQRARWQRYEIESYLLHPASLDRFVEAQVGPGDASKVAKDAWREALRAKLGGATQDFLDAPLQPPALVETYLRSTKARTEILPPLLTAAALPGFPYTRYHEIAAVMTPVEIHPEVKEKLDAIVRAFRQ